MIGLNMGARGGNGGSALLERLTRLEQAVAQIPSRFVNRPVDQARVYAATETGHGFTLGKWVIRTQALPRWRLASIPSIVANDVVGIVTRVVDADNFEVAFSGRVYMPTLAFTEWERYFVGPVPGVAVNVSPDHETDDTVPRTAATAETQVCLGLADGWLWLVGPEPRQSHNHFMQELGDVAYTGAAPTNGWTLIYRSGTGLWTPEAFPTPSLTLNDLTDVTIASVADKNFLRYDLATTQWKNYDLGPIAYATGTPNQLGLDGGIGGSATYIHFGTTAGSRFGIGSNAPIDFLLSGAVNLGTDKNARIRNPNSTQVSFYDQGTTTWNDGTEVLRWGCSSSAASRYFRFLVPLEIIGASATDRLIFGADTTYWKVTDDAGSAYLKFAKSGGGSIAHTVIMGTHLALETNRLVGESANGTSASYLLFSSTSATLSTASSGASGTLTLLGNVVNITASNGAATSLTLTCTGGISLVGNTKVASAAAFLGFFGSAGTARVAVAAAPAITATPGGGATNANVNALVTDVQNLQTAFNNLRGAANGYNLV